MDRPALRRGWDANDSLTDAQLVAMAFPKGGEVLARAGRQHPRRTPVLALRGGRGRGGDAYGTAPSGRRSWPSSPSVLSPSPDSAPRPNGMSSPTQERGARSALASCGSPGCGWGARNADSCPDHPLGSIVRAWLNRPVEIEANDRPDPPVSRPSPSPAHVGGAEGQGGSPVRARTTKRGSEGIPFRPGPPAKWTAKPPPGPIPNLWDLAEGGFMRRGRGAPKAAHVFVDTARIGYDRIGPDGKPGGAEVIRERKALCTGAADHRVWRWKTEAVTTSSLRCLRHPLSFRGCGIGT